MGDIKNNKSLNYILIILLVLVIGVVLYMIVETKNITNTSDNQIAFKITYYDELTPGSKSEIRIYDNKINITTTHFCSYVGCSPKTEDETFVYSKENMEKLKKYVEKNFNNNTEYNHFQLEKQQQEVIRGIIISENFFEINVEEYKYKLKYSKDNILTYNVYFKEDGTILVKKLNINVDYGIDKIKTYYLNFSKENLSILNDYIEKEVKINNSSTIYKNSTLKKEEKNIFKSILENDETYLNNINALPNLSYTISYSGINCLTPTLYLYNDNTYEYYYTFNNDNKELTPKTGTYNYDITKIIENIDTYEEINFGAYIIKDSFDNEYTTYNSNKELQEFLKSLDLTIEKCLVAE